jgi:RNA polymerase sigma factor (sigma-70 family)
MKQRYFVAFRVNFATIKIMEFTSTYIRRLKKRDQQAFSQLYTFLVDRLYRYLAGRYHLNRGEILDLVGDFFVKLRDRLDRIQEDQSVEAWIWTMFRNFVADWFKTKKQDRRLDVYDEMLYDEEADPARQAQNNHQLARIYTVLDTLDDLSREIIILKYVEDLSFESIARIVNLQPDAVRQRASRAIKTVQSLLRS